MYKCPFKLVVVYQHTFLIKIGFRPCMVCFINILATLYIYTILTTICTTDIRTNEYLL